MIKANELRIGNLVLKEDCIHPIGFYDFKYFGIDKIEPIPLTEEWLLKFGFEESDPGAWIKPDYEASYTNIAEDMMCVEVRDLSITLVSNDYGGLCSKVEYVHKLQNIWFAVTGEELKITEDYDK